MLWVYPVLDHMLDQTLRKTTPERIRRVAATAPYSRLGQAAFQQLRRRAGTGERLEPVEATGQETSAPESLLTAGTLAAVQDLQAADAEVLLRAMVAAAKADGVVDGEERRRIFLQMRAMGVTAQEREQIQNLLEAPQDVEDLLRRVHSPEMAEEVYVASLLVIQGESSVERDYLAVLARRLGLPRPVVERLHRQFGEIPPL